MKEKILLSIKEGVQAVEQLMQPDKVAFIEKGASLIAETIVSGHKLLIAGNGGSLCDANHFAEELAGYFRNKRVALPALCLSEPGFLSCVANDAGFDEVFSRGIEALGKKGDLFVGLTTSGNSKNLIRAFERAKERGLTTMAFLGKGGGKLKGVADLELIIEGFSFSDRIQEAHMTAIHIMIEMVEEILFNVKNVKEERVEAFAR